MTTCRDLRAIMPHQPPMLLVRRLLEAGDDEAEAEAYFDDDNPFAAGGRVDEAVHLELMAQTFAASMGAKMARSPRAGMGYLTSLKSLAVHGGAKTGEALRIKIRLTGRVENFFIIAGEVSQNDSLLAEGQVTILVPEG